MRTATETAQAEVLRTVQGMLSSVRDRTTITPALIDEKIGRVLVMEPSWGEGLDRQALVDELIRRFSIWTGKDSVLSDPTGHVPWLKAERRRERRYWTRYEDWLDRKLPRDAVEAVDTASESILEMLEDPLRAGPWDRRGMVVGHVQFGKTMNYTGLICKAADAGYKIIIVLAGLHNNLRAQTQMRLDEGFLGFETGPGEQSHAPIGAGMLDPDPAIAPDYATNRTDSGDFNPSNTRNLGITPDRRPCLFVVKKNKTPLTRLRKWLNARVADSTCPETGRRIISNLPILMIDDEADNASIDTGEQAYAPDGTPDEEHSPTAINREIRGILHAFTRKAYVGYTATPFANIFIPDRGKTREEGLDLFPSAFIYNLAASSAYIGPAKVFGSRGPEGRYGQLPLLRLVQDHAEADQTGGWMPVKHKNSHLPRFHGEDRMPDTLLEAIDAFILSCAARKVRGQGHDHASMLIHVTRFNATQGHVHRQVGEHLRTMKQRISRGIDSAAIIERLRGLWEADFEATTARIKADFPALSTSRQTSWEEVSAVIPDMLDEIKVRMINGTAKDALDYAEAGDLGLKVIAIGGDKLSRGLTLEGLVVSYFLRASKMYDTLMQMGRWFGYRSGYTDLCRLYTTQELVDWFTHITDASEELREAFDLMAQAGETPKTYGHKVASHPVLMVTSRLKMRSAKDLWLSFSGEVLETVVFFKEWARLQRNQRAIEALVAGMGGPQETDPTRLRNGKPQVWTGYLWNAVDSSLVTTFLDGFDTHPEAYKVNSALISEFITSMNEAGELTSWTVALIGGGEGASYQVTPDLKIKMFKRTDQEKPERYAIGRLLSPRDESIDLEDAEWRAALGLTVQAFASDPGRMSGEATRNPPTAPSGLALRKIRGQDHKERGLLLLYALDPLKAGDPLREGGPVREVFKEGTPPVIGFGVSFPTSGSGRKVRYAVNSVMWRQWERDYDNAE
jgi:hypothetical protein